MGVRRLGRWLGRLIVLGCLLWGLTFAAVAVGSIVLDRRTAVPAQADAIICLGAGMSRHLGWQYPDTASERRALTCGELHAQGVADRVIFTGYGHTRASAARAMADAAEAEGLPAAAVVIEDQARSTLQNAAYSLALFENPPQRVVLVSNGFHLPRAWVIFRAAGVPDVALVAAGPLPPERMVNRPQDGRTWLEWTTREATAIWFNVARATAYGIGGVMGIDHDTRIGWFN